jgi:hypothetical protein
VISNGTALYRINLIREMREREKKAEQQRSRAFTLGVACFGLFLLSLIYSGVTIWKMERVLMAEQVKLDRLKQEYRKYTAASLVVDKSDIELLNDLQGRGIFWTKKLAAMAQYLPDNYWITRFSFANDELRVSGYGMISPQQDQLLILDEYLNRLRNDKTFSDVFTNLHLNSAQRTDDGSARGAFEFSAYTGKWKAP